MSTPAITLIIPVSQNYPPGVELIGDINKKQTIDIDIIFSVCADPFNIAKARNDGSKSIKSEWLIFADADTIFDHDLFERMIAVGTDAVAGKTRRDIEYLNDIDISTNTNYYHCGFAPLLIKRELFHMVGGYCEQFKNYGYEDSDLEHKLPELPVAFDSRAHHIVSVHRAIARNGWNVDPNANANLFWQRQKMTKEDRIKSDLFDKIF
jgi:glycosyltransferase involved in cell wall biosynthesis